MTETGEKPSGVTGERPSATRPAPGVNPLFREPAYDETMKCVQCGYCLPACPTYETMGTETHSPRGRINLVRLTAEGRLTDWSLLAEALDLCLGCRACETACPSGVQYGRILEAARSAIRARRRGGPLAEAARSLLMRRVIPNKRVLNTLSGALWVYQKSGLEAAANRLKLTRLLPAPLAAFAAALPRRTSPRNRARRARTGPAERAEAAAASAASTAKPVASAARPRFRVAFFTGCVMDAMFGRINALSMELLTCGGCEVVRIPGETCCGALHAHAGEHGDAVRLARRNIEAFERLEESAGPVDFIVNNAGGCGAMLVEYPLLFTEEPDWRARAERFAAKCRDISVVLAQLELPLAGRGNERTTVVTYQRSCHMTHVQRVKDEPLKLLAAIPGIELREMADKDKCCGSAGIYNLVHHAESMAILDVRMRAVRATEAEIIVTTNPGCLLQMQLGIRRAGLEHRMRAVHLVELLAEACGL
jgi:glycolate oxidase iron-sulfur subunit